MKKTKALINLTLIVGSIILINILGNFFYSHLDLTEEKRFTLTNPSKSLLKGLKDVVYIRVLLDGDFPAGFKRLQSSTKEMLDDFRNVNGNVEYSFEDPNKGTVEEINARRKELAKDGIVPTNLSVRDNGEKKEKIIYPWAMVTYNGRTAAVNLLENQTPGMPQEAVLNNSVSLLEYKFANAIQKLIEAKKPNILFTEGHNELSQQKLADLAHSLSQYYNTGLLNLDSVVQIVPEVDILIVAKPRTAFDEKQKFKLDQYVMNGGKIIWLIDRLNADLDSLRRSNEYVPVDYPLNIEDMLFKYGARIQPNLVLDLECAKIPLKVGQSGQAAQFEQFPWYYHPLVTAKSSHPIVKSLDRVLFQFPSTIDTIKTKTNVKKTILLSSSQYSRLQFAPVRLNFEILRYEADATKFDKPFQPLAVLLEGEFSSLYENRVTGDMQAGLQKLNMTFKEKSVPTKQLVVSDGDIIANDWDSEKNVPRPLGQDRYARYVYANKDFILNAIEYMLDDNGIIEARSREVKLRLLDNIAAKNGKSYWQILNIAGPLALLGIFGFGFVWRRKKKYA